MKLRLLHALCSLPAALVLISLWWACSLSLPDTWISAEQWVFDRMHRETAPSTSRVVVVNLKAEDSPLLLAPWLDDKLMSGLQHQARSGARILVDTEASVLKAWSQRTGKLEAASRWRSWMQTGQVVAAAELPALDTAGLSTAVMPSLPIWGAEFGLQHGGTPSWPVRWLASLEAWQSWQWQGDTLQLGQRSLTLGANARLVAPLSTAGIERVDALSNDSGASVVVLTTRPQWAMVTLAQALALKQQRYAIQPVWAGWLGRGSLVLLALVVALCVPRTPVAWVGLGLLVLSLGLLLLQWWMLRQYSVWLPLLPALFGAWLLTPLGLAAGVHRRRRKALEARAEHSDLQRAGWLLQQGRAEEAVTVLAACQPGSRWLELMYEVGLAQERQRQYREAARTYQRIIGYRRRYRDAAQRAQSLRTLSQDSSPQNALASTLQLSADAILQLPQLGRYRLERELGRGAMGVVYLGRDPKIDRAVAIKTLNLNQFSNAERESVKTRFFREATAAGRLDHPNIVRVYDVGEEPDLAYIAMEWVAGEPLSQHVQEDTLLALPTVYNIVALVADALDYAHRQQVVHRDIKPGNILFVPDQRQVKVSDFGIARITDESLTRTGEMLGSPLYMSAEQLKGNKITGASDIYSLGVTFFQLLSGGLPFVGDSIPHLSHQIINSKPRSPRSYRASLPAGSVRLVNKAIQRTPGDRYRSGAEMAEAVRKALVREFGQGALWR